MRRASVSDSLGVRYELYIGAVHERLFFISYQVEIHIICTKIFQRFFESWSYIYWIVLCIPEFARNLSQMELI